jgi:hypothetical protein
MGSIQKDQKSENKEERKSKSKEDRELSEELEMSFPASDAPAATQPGSGITGPEVASFREGQELPRKPRRSS